MRKLAAFMALMMITMACLSTAFAEEHDIRIHTFAVPTKNKVNVRREPAGSIRGTIDMPCAPDGGWKRAFLRQR